MQAIVLVGGLGTRLRELLGDVPKPMAPVRGRPFLAFVLDRLVEAHFESVVLACGYRHEVLRAHFGESYRGLALTYSVEARPLGTGGAIRLAWDSAGAGDDVFALNGDTWLELDFQAMLAAHRRAGAPLTMAVCHVADAARYGALDLDGDIVRRFAEKGATGAGWINAGVYVLGPSLRERFPAALAFSFEHDLLAREVSVIRPRAFRSTGSFIDIGTPEDYARAQALLPG